MRLASQVESALEVWLWHNRQFLMHDHAATTTNANQRVPARANHLHQTRASLEHHHCSSHPPVPTSCDPSCTPRGRIPPP